MKALIDADSLLYTYAHTHQKTFKWSEDQTSIDVDEKGAIEDLDTGIARILQDTKATDYKCYLTGKTNFRYEVLSTYKHNRKDLKKPELYDVLKDHMLNNYNTTITSKIEADDVLTIYLTKDPKAYIACHIDKDIDQAWGNHYNYKTRQFYEITKEEADYWFYMQVLTGDPTDGYKGCPGIGKVKADLILEGLEGDKEIWEGIVHTYECKDLTEEVALQQARVARMLRYTDWDFKKKEVILWNPPQT